MKNKVCILARVSTSHQNPDHQVSTLQEYCLMRGYEVTHIISTVVTGNTSNQKRDDIAELLTEARKKKFSKVVVTEVSRVGRRANEIRKVLDDLHSLGVSVVFKQLGVESLDDDGRPTFITNLIIGIYSELAQYEREQLSDRIKSGLAHARKNGKVIGRVKGTVETPQEILTKYKPVVRALKDGLSLRQIEKIHEVSRTTVCKVKRALEAA